MPIDPNISEPDDERREGSRISVSIDVTTRERGRKASHARVANLSTQGCMIDGDFFRLADSDAWVCLPGLDSTPSRVMWVDGARAGLLFERALHPAVFDHVVRRADSAFAEAKGPANARVLRRV